MRKHLLAIGAALALAPCLLAQKIGIINTMTGPEAPIGQSLANGIRLAEEDLKRKGLAFQLIWEDDTGKPQLALQAMEKLATRDSVVGVVGPYTSACAHAVAQRAEKLHVPLLIPAAAKEEITRQGFQHVFRLNAPAHKYASSLIDAALSLGSPKTIAFIYENTDYGTSTSQTAKDYVATKGLKIVADVPYPKGFADYRSTLTQIKTKNPDLVFMVSYADDALLLMRQSREVGLQPQAFLGAGGGFTTMEFARETAISENVLSCTQWTDDVNWPGAKQFSKRFKARFGQAPTYHAACGYASLMILVQTVKSAGGDRVRTRQGLKAGKWDGVMGEVKFADFDGFTNQNDHPMLVQQILNGNYETVLPAKFATKKAVYPFPMWK
jgi:branched-chain amino acid transport system substrate-binding protein